MYASLGLNELMERDKHILRIRDLNSIEHPGGRLNKKDGLTRYGDSHDKDKTS